MGRFDDRSKLKTREIKKVLLNRKDYNFQDFHFKIKEKPKEKWMSASYDNGFFVEVYNFDVLILRLDVENVTKWAEKDKALMQEDKFRLGVTFFNPQTDNDIHSINHVIAVYKDMTLIDERHEDRGNVTLLNNQYIFRKKDNFYTYTKIWTKGEIKEDNFDKDLTHEFALNEYINFIKRMYKFKTIQRRGLKAEIRTAIDKAIGRELKKKLVDSL